MTTRMRDEEKPLHDLPDSPSTMSAREGLCRAVWRSWYGDVFDFGDEAGRMSDIDKTATLIDRELRSLGFVIVPAAASPEPKVT